MIMRRIWGVIPVPIFVTDNMPPITGGYAKGPFVWIRPRYISRQDEGIIQHELNHVKQFYIPVFFSMIASWLIIHINHDFFQYVPIVLSLGIAFHPLMYKFNDSYRLWSEVSCYRIQATYYADHLDKLKYFAELISTTYNLYITKTKAFIMLMS